MPRRARIDAPGALKSEIWDVVTYVAKHLTAWLEFNSAT